MALETITSIKINATDSPTVSIVLTTIYEVRRNSKLKPCYAKVEQLLFITVVFKCKSFQ